MSDNNLLNPDNYPFLQYIKEDKSNYIHAKDAGYYDPDDLFLIGDSGGLLLNINYGDKFINTHLFTEVANYYKNNKTFCPYNVDSIPHRQFRKREEYRRKYGLSRPCLKKANGEIVNIRITGDHYNFINYTIIEQLDENSIILGKNSNTARKHKNFSKFIDAQFWTFHIMEFVQRNAKHLIICKTRRGGFSYIMASDSANTINLNSNKVVIHVADNSDYLTDTGGLSDFTINNLRFYENETPFKRGIISTKSSDFKLGYKYKNGVEASDSWKSACISVSANNNPNCAIGKDAIKVKVEEVSTMTNFKEFMNVTEPAMRTGAFTTGCLMAWGTATSGDMSVFENYFYAPQKFNFAAFENVWDKDSRNDLCGYFKPYCWGLQGVIDGKQGLDEDGNSNIEIGLKISNKEREQAKASKSFAEYINYLGQYAEMPSESFNSATENVFVSKGFLEWETKLKNNSDYNFYVDGMLIEDERKNIIFKSNERLIAEGGILNKNVFNYIESVPRKSTENPHGCIRKFFNPQKIEVYENNKKIYKIPDCLYSISYDPVGINKEKKEINLRHSHNSIKVWMNPHHLNNFRWKLVASYYGRPDTLEESDKICYLLAKYYNCKGTTGVEVNRGETISNFNKWNAKNYLEKEPLFVWNSSLKGNNTYNYGYIISDGKKRYDGIRLLVEMLNEEISKDENGNSIYGYNMILDYPSILELKKWNNFGNFDRVSEMLIRAIQYKAINLKAEKELNKRKKVEVDDYSNDILHRDWY